MQKRKFSLSRLAASVGSAVHDRLFGYLQRSGLVLNLVIDNKIETKGTQVFFDNSGSVLKITCPTAVTGVNGGAKDQIDTTCLDVVGSFREFVGGFATADVVNIPFVLYDGDASHLQLKALQDSGAVIGWAVGLSDSTTAPTVIDSDGNITLPAARSGFAFKGYVANLTFDMDTNEVVRGTLSIQPTGNTTFQQGT